MWNLELEKPLCAPNFHVLFRGPLEDNINERKAASRSVHVPYCVGSGTVGQRVGESVLST